MKKLIVLSLLFVAVFCFKSKAQFYSTFPGMADYAYFEYTSQLYVPPYGTQSYTVVPDEADAGEPATMIYLHVWISTDQGDFDLINDTEYAPFSNGKWAGGMYDFGQFYNYTGVTLYCQWEVDYYNSSNNTYDLVGDSWADILGW